MNDRIISAVSSDGFISMTVAVTRQTVERARQIHHTSPLATAALGRTLTAAAMLGYDIKAEDGSVTIQIKGGGPIGGILAVADSTGNPRGYVYNPGVDLPKRPDGKLDVGTAVGRDGLLTVIKDLGMREPYIGKVELVSGEIAEDITAYLYYSEQTPAVCALGVLVDVDLSVRSAGGYIIRLLPGAPAEIADRVEQLVRSAGSVTEMLSAGMTAEDLVQHVLIGFQMKIAGGTEIAYTCNCSPGRVRRALVSLGENELRDMDGKPVEVVCQFCDKVYSFTSEELLHGLNKNE